MAQATHNDVTTVVLTGTAKWCKLVEPDEMYGRWTLNLYLDDNGKKVYDQCGIRVKVRSDEDGEFITLRRPSTIEKRDGTKMDMRPPKVYGPDRKPMDGDTVGNGSKVSVGVEIYDTNKGKGHRISFVGVRELVEYKKKPKVDW